MSMTPRERMLAVLKGEEPDKTPICVYGFFLAQTGPEWYWRLKKRGLALVRSSQFCKPQLVLEGAHPGFDDIRVTTIKYVEKGIYKSRYTYETPVGSITGVTAQDRKSDVTWGAAPEEYLIKQPADWWVVNHIIKEIIDNLVPSYELVERVKCELGEDGVTCAVVTHTAWQMAWMRLAGPERAAIDFHEQPDGVQEYIELQRRWHSRWAEFAAGCPAQWIFFADHISDMTSPKYYREYSLPIYEIFNKQLAGSGKTLTVHMDGRLGNLRKLIAETPIDAVESFSVPPTGDISLAEAKKIWPSKMIFMNTAAHMAWAKPAEVRSFYEGLADEWGGKKGLMLELVEQIPIQTVDAHMSAALDAFGY